MSQAQNKRQAERIIAHKPRLRTTPARHQAIHQRLPP